MHVVGSSAANLIVNDSNNIYMTAGQQLETIRSNRSDEQNQNQMNIAKPNDVIKPIANES